MISYNSIKAFLVDSLNAAFGTLANPIRTQAVGTQDVNVVSGSTSKAMLFASISQGSAGTTQLVAAVTAKKIKVASYAFVMDLAGTAKFQSASTDLTGSIPCAASGGIAATGNTDAWLLETAAGEALNITTTTGKAAGHLGYFTEA